MGGAPILTEPDAHGQAWGGRRKHSPLRRTHSVGHRSNVEPSGTGPGLGVGTGRKKYVQGSRWSVSLSPRINF